MDLHILPNICIEIDGFFHTTPEGKECDKIVDEELKKQGQILLRYPTKASGKKILVEAHEIAKKIKSYLDLNKKK